MKVIRSRDVIFREEIVYKEDRRECTSHGNLRSEVPNLVSLELEGSQGEEAANEPEGGTTDMETSVENEEDTEEGGENLDNYQLAKDRTRRQARPPKRLEDYQCDAADGEDVYMCYICDLPEDGMTEPSSWRETMEDPDSDQKTIGCKWREAAGDKMVSLKKNGTWVLVDKPEDQKTIGCKWMFKRKPGILGVDPPRHKGRLVGKSYSQQEGVDFQEIFAPVVKHVSIRYILSTVVHFNMELQQMDVKTAFLHGLLDEKIYMDQLEGFVDMKNPQKVCLLKRSLYGLKQSPRQWNRRFDDFVRAQGYTRSEYDQCVYFKKNNEGVYVYMLLYVDEILIASVDKAQVDRLKRFLSSEFEMKDRGDAKKILGMEILKNRETDELWISQKS